MAKRTNIRLSNVLPKRKAVRPQPRLVAKIGRNDACPCGSGKKYKDCHEAAGESFLAKIAMERAAELRATEEGPRAPWYRRLFGRS